jgi:hypothetical protein
MVTFLQLHFMVQEPKAIIECVNDKSLRSNFFDITHHTGFRMVFCYTSCDKIPILCLVIG